MRHKGLILLKTSEFQMAYFLERTRDTEKSEEIYY